jgi:hypothetical protein
VFNLLQKQKRAGKGSADSHLLLQLGKRGLGLGDFCLCLLLLMLQGLLCFVELVLRLLQAVL